MNNGLQINPGMTNCLCIWGLASSSNMPSLVIDRVVRLQIDIIHSLGPPGLSSPFQRASGNRGYNRLCTTSHCAPVASNARLDGFAQSYLVLSQLDYSNILYMWLF